MTNTKELVEVTQADRDAAVACIRFLPMDALWAGTIQRGERDDHVLVQAFARHRILALESSRPPVAGSREKLAIERVRDALDRADFDSGHVITGDNMRLSDVRILLALATPEPPALEAGKAE